jgi:hypothetical protein
MTVRTDMVGSPGRATRVRTGIMDVTDSGIRRDNSHQFGDFNSMGPYSLSLGDDTNWNLSDVKARSRT